jgi:hypothetical protein
MHPPKPMQLIMALALVGPGVLAVVPRAGAQTAFRPLRGSYRPVTPPPSINVSGGGGWPGLSAPGTAASSAMNGMASMMSAAGSYNMQSSAAAINMSVAQRNQLQNDMLATDTYFQMRTANEKYRAAEAGPKPTMEQLVRLSKDGAPRQLTSSQMDPVSGGLSWPAVLQDDNYKEPRTQVDELFAKRTSQGGLNYTDQSDVRHAVETMSATLKSQIRDIPPQDYEAARNFLNSVVYAAAKTAL